MFVPEHCREMGSVILKQPRELPESAESGMMDTSMLEQIMGVLLEHALAVSPAVPGVPGRADKDGRARRPSFIKTAVLGVDARALQSSDMIEQMAYSGRHLQGPAVTCRAPQSPAVTGRNPAHSIS
ncbi:hypothetical protein L873DRAFT_1845563 [Choiromyces venosus 120613-1]|uniref:Uncharacterized protein n=1 Tax=Choiromyces venosus 120613-1 TaxID=1336337 RepID=A0A3N4JD66_9PEZI|nr:hypothetical protein L873DRAFT_1845563 [Choiromyces venosus 120613-1]